MAKTPMPRGWLAENKTNEVISQLYNSAATIAAVRHGVVQEAYVQVRRCSSLTYFHDYNAYDIRCLKCQSLCLVHTDRQDKTVLSCLVGVRGVN